MLASKNWKPPLDIALLSEWLNQKAAEFQTTSFRGTGLWSLLASSYFENLQSFLCERHMGITLVWEAYFTGNLPGSHGATIIMMPPRPDQPVTLLLHSLAYIHVSISYTYPYIIHIFSIYYHHASQTGSTGHTPPPMPLLSYIYIRYIIHISSTHNL